MEWIAANDASFEFKAKTQGNEIAHETAEDDARRDYDAALLHMRNKQFHEAKTLLRNVVGRDLLATTFRSRLFKAAYKNLGRCYEELGDAHGALQAFSFAALNLAQEDQDVALWFMIRRQAKAANHLPLFDFADKVLHEICSEDEITQLAAPSSDFSGSCSLEINELLSDTFLVLIKNTQELTWNGLLSMLCTVPMTSKVIIRCSTNNSECAAKGHAVNEEASREDSSSATIDALGITVPPVPIATSSTICAPSTPRARPKRGSEPVKLKETKRQQQLHAAIPESKSEESIGIDPHAFLISEDKWIFDVLLSNFRSARYPIETNGVRTPTLSPLKQSIFFMSEEAEADALQSFVTHVTSLNGSKDALTFFNVCYDFLYDSFDTIPARAVSTIYTILDGFGVTLSEEKNWLGLLCKAESLNARGDKSARELVEMEVDLQLEMQLLEFAARNPPINHRLAVKTLKRCVENARKMKRPILMLNALDVLDSLDGESAFSARERKELSRLISFNSLDTVIEENNPGSPRFAKGYMQCLSRVQKACLENNRPDVLARYVLDVVGHALMNDLTNILSSVLEVRSHEWNSKFLIDGDNLDELQDVHGNSLIWPDRDELQRISCEIFRLHPELASKSSFDILEGRRPESCRLWSTLVPWFWAFACAEDNNEGERGSDRHVECLKRACIDFKELVHCDPLALETMLVLMVDRDAKQCVVSALRASDITKNSPLETIERVLSLCEWCLDDDSSAAEAVFDFLLHDERIRTSYNELRTGGALSDTMLCELEDRRERILAEAACQFYLSGDPEDAENDTDTSTLSPKRNSLGSIRRQQPEFLQANLTQIWEFIAPHLWCTRPKTEQVLDAEEKKTFLQKTLLPAISMGPVTKEVYDIHEGGVWLHLVKLDVTGDDENPNEEDVENEQETKVNATKKVQTSDESPIVASNLWLERDLQVEPQRLWSLFALGQMLFKNEHARQIEEKRIQKKEAPAKSTSAHESDGDCLSPREGIAGDDTLAKTRRTIENLDKFKAKRYHSSEDCFGEIDKVLARQLPQGLRAASLVKWRGRWAILCRLTASCADILIIDEQSRVFNKLKESVRAELGDGVEQGKNSPSRQASKRMKSSDAQCVPLMKQRVLRGVPLSDLSPFTVDDFVLSDSLTDVTRYFLADILPSDLIKLRLDVSEYSIVQEDSELKHLSVEQDSIQQSIEMCRWINDDRAWAFHWFNGYVREADDDQESREIALKSFSEAADLAQAVIKRYEAKNASKKQRTLAFNFYVAAHECLARACQLRLQMIEGTDNEVNIKMNLLEDLKKTLKRTDAQNFLTGRILQTQLGSEDETLGHLLGSIKRWDTGSVLFDYTREQDWEDEISESFATRVAALKLRSQPLEGATALLEIVTRRKFRRVVSPADFDELQDLIVRRCIPNAELSVVLVLSSQFSSRYPPIKKACDARLLELGAREFGLNTIGEILDKCRQEFPNLSQSRKPGSKLYKSGMVPGTSAISKSASSWVEKPLSDMDKDEATMPETQLDSEHIARVGGEITQQSSTAKTPQSVLVEGTSDPQPPLESISQVVQSEAKKAESASAMTNYEDDAMDEDSVFE